MHAALILSFSAAMGFQQHQHKDYPDHKNIIKTISINAPIIKSLLSNILRIKPGILCFLSFLGPR
jgi:hypothetical protein